ncbi:MAG: membrane protein insertase YidC [Chloroflexi bacterium]|nr:membrane protein insertase YidC [Chloroflexota bacterium]
MEIIGILGVIWNAVIIDPMINSLVLLYSIFFNNFGVSILIFTVMMRGVMFPLTVRQSRQMKKMSEIQPKVKELQQRYAKDKQKISQETMRIYKEHGVNPIGCLGPMFLQFPIWIGLYRSILQILPAAPDSLVGLSGHLYSWLPRVHAVIPLDSSFLWLDLAEPDSLVLPIMVGVSMYLMQKMTVMPSADPRQASTNRMMLWMMPLMFGFFTTQFSSGLAVYWVVSNMVGMAIQGFITGWGPITSLFNFRRAEEPAAAAALVPSAEETVHDAPDRDDSEDSGRSHRNRSKGTRRRPRRGRNGRR